ncbi:SDR family NAD(P)-dependent oxidoreductase [Nocardia jiangxiensis]|uniref:SDR family NAD(P)-dependent oxidoreductase n=1 Tax=Nocardia jiangxiensis TaxID=282685 RepID=UPI0002F92F15|nr:SDR family oxidoreductase [Nocardia jiangxiensis]
MTTSRPAALVTGAGGGIGRAVAVELAATHNLILTDIFEASLRETQALTAPVGAAVHAQVADIARPGELDRVVTAGEKTLGTVSAAVACAGIEGAGTVETSDIENWQRSLNVNLTGTFLTARAVIASLKATAGSFTAIASDAGTNGFEDCVGYIAAKHGVIGVVRAMAVDHGRDGVRSNVVCPGYVETPMARRILADSPEGTEDFYRSVIPLGRFATPQDVAAVVRHFVAGSTYANGVVYALDGGSTVGSYRGA